MNEVSLLRMRIEITAIYRKDEESVALGTLVQ